MTGKPVALRAGRASTRGRPVLWRLRAEFNVDRLQPLSADRKTEAPDQRKGPAADGARFLRSTRILERGRVASAARQFGAPRIVPACVAQKKPRP
jgi:hypothetical protein